MKGKSCLAFVLFLLLAAFVGVFLAKAELGSPSAGASVAVAVPAGADASQVADLLAQNGLVSNGWWYRAYAWIDEAARRPKAGTYRLRPGMSLRLIARILALGVPRDEVSVTVIEGSTADDLTALLQDKFAVAPSSTIRVIGRSVDRAPFDPAYRTEFAFVRDLPRDRSLEGYLFPDTYRVWRDQLPESLISKQLEEFDKRFGGTPMTQASAPLTTLDQAVILASIVEREVQTPEDRRLVAGIFLKRLKLGMALQSDATISYLTGSSRDRSAQGDLAIDSPYNTYRVRGLPPGPIGNPGADAIQAVLHPTPSAYLYFLTDKDGKVRYARTLEEHALNRRQAGY